MIRNPRRPHPLCPILAAVFLASSGPVLAQTSGAPGLAAPVQEAWTRVRAALTPEQQANAVRGFVSTVAATQGRAATPGLDARDIASGRTVALDDPALLPGLLDGLPGWVPQLQLRRVEGATHWIVHEHPERVAMELQRFLQSKQ